MVIMLSAQYRFKLCGWLKINRDLSGFAVNLIERRRISDEKYQYPRYEIEAAKPNMSSIQFPFSQSSGR